MKAILKMDNITKSFGSGHNKIQALKGINLEVNQGEFVSIIGPSGSGKSTFLTISGGLQSPTSGNITINGLNFTPLSEKKRSKLRFKEIGFILQSSNLIPYLTLEEQFLLIDKINHEKLASKKGLELLDSLDILDLKNKYPSDLSGGERQRAAIARALFNEPNLILADEPTASLDTEHAYQVVELLRQEAHLKNKATIMVTHDQRMIKNSDSVYQIEDGLLSKI
ncbi:ABC-type antimicrobial peptide transport system, ATPase component [Lactococcus cremoris subsp. cremoris SK11]|uniref:Putative hemin import ATP-binding protein HrtA n=2 Tax=Lactococcus lactis subsp. cremoris TaxID=1359 RepID=Q030X1_LACLS|nr:ABC transporter ATP-binding protein [Lactococcus cremoris]ABJ72251.1 ABC-type antimicrobial peptide transport system, ATPase component [Lactococcus cremoris subsp. cremoris SK11]ARE22849.1 ABC transporter ATP-binding protein [Lactococcus cremoris]KZK46668.1 ABC transporter ATP-binding protein [Lactococcus cremoris]KZK52612.1 ABC transporter ATP-binding protein [Lactococcus cremoris]MCT4408979.1 ABC transporter ATP-binding protein [Lactococcus cremoris]